MDFKDWMVAIREGKTLYRIKPTESKYTHIKVINAYYVQMWRWWWPFSWKTVYGLEEVRYTYQKNLLISYDDCKNFINTTTEIFERE